MSSLELRQKEEFVNTMESFKSMFLGHLSAQERVAGLRPEDRLAGLRPEEILKNFSPEDRLAGLGPEDIKKIKKYLDRA